MRRGRILMLQPPSPPFLNVMRDYAGGYGVASKSARSSYGHEGAVVPSESLLYGAGILMQAGYHVSMIDGQAEQFSLADIISRIEREAPDIIISVLSLPSLAGDLALLMAVQEQMPWIQIISIGTACKELHRTVMESSCVRAVVRGDPEIVLPNLVPAVLENTSLSEIQGIAFRDAQGEVTVTPSAPPLSDLDALPTPPFHLLPMERYWHGSFGEETRYMEILDSRGCPFPCGSYCPYPFAFGRKVLFADPERVVEEIAYLNKRFGVRGFIFRGQTFTLRRKHAESICEKLLERELPVRWLCETRLDCVDLPLLQLMKRAGCERIHYGLESGDPEQFEKVGKPGCDLSKLGNAIAETKSAGIHARVNIIIGLPDESWKTVRRTIRTLREWRPSSVLAAIITPYPGTALYEDARRQGLLIADDWSEFTGFHPVMRTEHLSPTDLIAAKEAVENCLLDTSIVRRVARKGWRMLRPPSLAGSGKEQGDG